VTIRATDQERGERYVWMTPEPAKMLLLAFDQGWDPLTGSDTFLLRDPLQITKIRKHGSTADKVGIAREKRKAQLEAKETAGEEMTRREKQGLSRMRSTDARHKANGTTTSAGPVKDVRVRGDKVTVVGSTPVPVNPTKNPNILTSRKRIFGMKTVKPGLAFEAAVKEAVNEVVERRVAERLADLGVGEAGGATQTRPTPTRKRR
jgi:hypothetical protein